MSIHTGKTIALTICTYVSKVLSLLFNILPYVCHSVLSKEQGSFSFMEAVTIHSNFGAQENKICQCFHFFPSVWHEMMGLDAMILVIFTLSFKSAFSVSSFTIIKELFSSSSLSAIRVIYSAYLRLLIFLLEILIPACASSSLAFYTMYSSYKLNKQGNNIKPWWTPFSILNQSVAPCLVLTVASWPEYTFTEGR